MSPATLFSPPDATPTSPTRLRRIGTAIALALLATALLLVTAPQIGLTWDEPAYIRASESYVGWFALLLRAPQSANLRVVRDQYWTVNHEHPPLNKLWSGLVWAAARPFTDDLTAHRLGNMVLAGLLVALLYLMAAPAYGELAGVLAAVALLSMPRVFFHAHLAALDLPAAIAYLLVIALFWYSHSRRGWWWGLVLGMVWGIGLAVKINAAFALPVLVLWSLAAARSWHTVGRLAQMTLVGPLVFVALWPWLYHDTVARLFDYISWITVTHWQIGQWYLGAFFMPPPWHFSFVMALAVIPATLLMLAVAGLVRGLRDPRPGHPVLLWLVSGLMPLLALTTGRSMVYDNERLFMGLFPFVALLAGTGLAGVYAWLRRLRHAGPVLATLTLMVAFAPQLVRSAVLYPHLLSYYSETVGGLAGARRIGLETTYWCETYAAFIPYLNANAPQQAIIWTETWSHDVLLYYQTIGELRADLRIALTDGTSSFADRGFDGIRADLGTANYAIIATRETGLHVNPTILPFQRARTPLVAVVREGVQLAGLYRR